ncbi:DNA-3-methyladenine glycosylase 2 family protein [Mangrovimicrobium sediminis]|uniref:DNA-3-methyladenine glycosylase II n=1 Tax=Mangrovimicrobium sediminis TaxID=2562682 RepID=A0A4Z0M6K3_9GAMM|nr:AlkA N-terminal domain-containing protein [Haliea sp. SAOS-164]TGD75302.1 DNA-3-methyladenine glycosylase 2 family protein [Haliea sp. SAOS-164]
MTAADLDPSHCYAAVKAHDTRFDGVFFVGVTSTGVYCRPVCRVRTPLAKNCRFFAHAAAAEQAGFRPCLRCRPELAPGNAPSDAVSRLAQRAAIRIREGALQGDSLENLAAQMQVSSRQLRRAVEQEFGVSPIALAQTYRLLLAKQLLTETSLKVVDIAFASGYSSLRRFNDAFRRHYRLSPSDLRSQRGRQAAGEGVRLRLSYRPPLAWEALAGFLGSRSGGGLVSYDGERFTGSLRTRSAVGWFSARDVPGQHHLEVHIAPALVPQISQVVAQLRQLFDLDAHPQVVDAQLAGDPLLAPLVAATPGLRIPGTVDGFELALRAVLGQQVSVRAASTVFTRFVERFGEPLETPLPGIERLPPDATAIAAADVTELATLGLNRRRAETVWHLARLVAEGTFELHPGTDVERTRAQLLAIPGIGPWTTDYIAMRALGDPDAMPQSDLGLMRALGVDKPAGVHSAAQGWRPWRAYGAMHCWHCLASGG